MVKNSRVGGSGLCPGAALAVLVLVCLSVAALVTFWAAFLSVVYLYWGVCSGGLDTKKAAPGLLRGRRCLWGLSGCGSLSGSGLAQYPVMGGGSGGGSCSHCLHLCGCVGLAGAALVGGLNDGG